MHGRRQCVEGYNSDWVNLGRRWADMYVQYVLYVIVKARKGVHEECGREDNTARGENSAVLHLRSRFKCYITPTAQHSRVVTNLL